MYGKLPKLQGWLGEGRPPSLSDFSRKVTRRRGAEGVWDPVAKVVPVPLPPPSFPYKPGGGGSPTRPP